MQTEESRHCDDYIRDKSQPKALRKFLFHRRLPAVYQYDERMIKRLGGTPNLFAVVKEDLQPLKDYEGKQITSFLAKGTKVRVVMASRFGDVGITVNLKAENGYSHRVAVECLTDFAEAP